MTTTYPSEQEISDAVTQWVHEQIIEARAGKLISFHVNQIVPTLPFAEGSRYVFDTSLVMFTIAKNVLREHYADEPRFLLLIMPVGYGVSHIKGNYPKTVDALIKQLNEEPPSLYLLSPYTYFGWSTWEQYHVPLPFAIQSEDPQLSVYYAEQRDPQSIKNNWEFSRSVHMLYWVGPI